jgi:hypothetical protein
LHELHGHSDAALQRKAPKKLLELRTVREAPAEFAKTVNFRKGEALRLYTDKQECFYVIFMCMLRPPAIMAELRLLHRYLLKRGINLDVRHLPSSLYPGKQSAMFSGWSESDPLA